MNPRIVFPARNVGLIVLVGVCLSLKGYISICLVSVFVLNEPYDPLDAVPKEKEDDQHLFLLLAVNMLMVTGHDIEPRGCGVPYEDERPKTHRHEALEGNDVVKYYFHIF
jgi:hypothetical protein